VGWEKAEGRGTCGVQQVEVASHVSGADNLHLLHLTDTPAFPPQCAHVKLGCH